MKNRTFVRQEERKNIGNRRVGNRTADSAERQKGEPVKGRETSQSSSHSTPQQKPYLRVSQVACVKKSYLPAKIVSPMVGGASNGGSSPAQRAKASSMKENLLFKSDFISES